MENENDNSNEQNDNLNEQNDNSNEQNYNSIKIFFDDYIKTPNLWYYINPEIIVLKYNLSIEDGLELYSAYVKDQVMLFSTVIYRNTLFLEKMANVALCIGWIINLVGIIIPVTNIDMPITTLILLTGVGNIIAIIITTIIKYISIDDKIQIFKIMIILLTKLHDEISMMQEGRINQTDELNKQLLFKVRDRIREIKGIVPFTISKSTIDYHYNQDHQKNLNHITILSLINSIYYKKYI